MFDQYSIENMDYETYMALAAKIDERRYGKDGVELFHELKKIIESKTDGPGVCGN